MLAWAVVLLCGSPAAGAEPRPAFDLPVACTPGVDCWNVNYFDQDPGPGMRDYACGRLGYDGHEGTDFALRDRVAMARGVAVVAAAPGVVKAIRDGMADISVAKTGPEAVEGRRCGNGVLLDHAGGWETQYCHLRQGSVAVNPGDSVDAGQMLGLVGLSGLTEFPHLEFIVRFGGQKLDPFVGRAEAVGCEPSEAPLWSEAALDAQPYLPFALYNSGFADRVPDADEVRGGEHHNAKLFRTAEALVLWVEVFGVEAGDGMSFHILAPDGSEVLVRDRRFEKHFARWFGYAGKRRPAEGWPPGVYRGEVHFRRDIAGAVREDVLTAEVDIR